MQAQVLRDEMTDALERLGVARSPAVVRAFRAVPRHVFVPDVPLERAYTADVAVPIGANADGLPVSSASAPSIMAVMLEQLEVAPGMAVLEVGTGTGYNAAVLAELAGPDGHVATIELDPSLADAARRRLADLGAEVDVLAGDGWDGARATVPYDRLIVTVGVSDISRAWVAQLREGGRVVVPLWLGPGLELAAAFDRHGDRLDSRGVEWCGFMPLRGEHAGPQRQVVAGEWIVAMHDATGADVDALRELLTGPSERQPGPERPPYWFGRLAMAEPDAIMLVGRTNWRRRGWGIFDRATASVAVVVDKDLWWAGVPDARHRLVEFLVTCRPLDVRALTIRAVPSGTSIDGAGTTIPRVDHTFVLEGGPAPS